MSEHCEYALEHLYLYLDREIEDVALFERIRAHLVDCPPCGSAFAFEERFKVVVRTNLAEEVPVEVMERLRALVKSQAIGGGFA